MVVTILYSEKVAREHSGYYVMENHAFVLTNGLGLDTKYPVAVIRHNDFAQLRKGRPETNEMA